MRELDAVLQGFLESAYAELTDADRLLLAEILELPDPVLHGYLVRRHEPSDPRVAQLITRIRDGASLRA